MIRGVRIIHALPLFCVLFGCLVAAWAHRFVPEDGASCITLDGLRFIGDEPGGVRTQRDGIAISATPGKPTSASFAIPAIGEPRVVFLRFHVVADAIEVGSNRWDDGRLFFEWIKNDEVVGISRITSAHGSKDEGIKTVAIESPVRGAVPILYFQNLGASGTFEIRMLEFVAARERKSWSLGKWLLAAGFLTVVAALVGGTKKPARWRGWVAAAVWMVVAVSYAFPGPWEVARPFITPFVFPEAPAFEAGADQEWRESAATIENEEPLIDRLPPPTDIGLRLKLGLPWLRPLLHLALLFAPVLAMAWFVGARRAFWLGWALSLSIEAAQTLYGFGFGWDDVWDLLVNGIAISAAVWAHRKFATRLHARLPFPFPEPAAKVARAGLARRSKW